MGINIVHIVPAPIIAEQSIWQQPAVTAAIVAAILGIIVLFVNTALNIWMHTSKLKFDSKLAREKFEFDQALSEKKYALDFRMEAWKRKSGFAEEQLAVFYDFRSKISSIRSPASYGSENNDRVGRETESDELRQWRDTYYPVLKRIKSEGTFFDEFYARRFRAVALFGERAEAPYVEMWRALISVQVSVMSLLRPDALLNRNQSAQRHREEMEKVIWEGLADNDSIAARVDSAISSAEAIFRPIIESIPE